MVAGGRGGSVVDVVDEPALEVVGALGFCGPESGVGDLGAEGPVAALAILSGRPDTRSEAIIVRSITLNYPPQKP